MNIRKKKALVLTYHVKNCVRRGGFHEFIDYLKEWSYDIDWVTCTMSASWIINRNDRENIHNFFELWKGMDFTEGESRIRHFAVPVMVPAKIAKYVNRKLFDCYWPKWKNVRKRLSDNYDVILVEGVACQYAIDLKRSYPNAQIIYRPSDILESFSSVKNPKELEKKMIETADVTYCVDENQVKYYSEFVTKKFLLKILRNPITTQKDVDSVDKRNLEEHSKKSAVYVGVSGIDLDYIEYAAQENGDTDFFVIGPFDKKSHDNVFYLGTLSSEQFSQYLENADVGINPIHDSFKSSAPIGYTRKIVRYMKYLMPIVATNSDNYLDVNGFFVAKDKEEFALLINQAVNYTIEERMSLKRGYEEVMKIFLDTNVKEQMRKAIEEKEY